MTDKPILFSGSMVRAILEGRKTQTRRVLKPQPRSAPIKHDGVWTDCSGFKEGPYGIALRDEVASIKIPHAIGDRLWVKENHYAFGHWETTDQLTRTGKRKRCFVRNHRYDVQFQKPESVLPNNCDHVHGWYARLGRFMFKADNRITLLVTDVRVERLQDISETDAITEGLEVVGDYPRTQYRDYSRTVLGTGVPRLSFKTLWNSINGPDAWDANPWVAAYTFEPVLQNIDQIEEAA